jgi:hypothetical protein
MVDSFYRKPRGVCGILQIDLTTFSYNNHRTEAER